MEKPSRGGEKRTAAWASHPKERESDDVVAPPVCDHRVVPHRWVVFDRSTPRGQPRTPAMILPHGCEGLRVRWMAVLWRFCRPFMGRPVRRQCLRNAVLDLTIIVAATAYHRRSYAERYSRSMKTQWKWRFKLSALPKRWRNVTKPGWTVARARPRVTAWLT